MKNATEIRRPNGHLPGDKENLDLHTQFHPFNNQDGVGKTRLISTGLENHSLKNQNLTIFEFSDQLEKRLRAGLTGSPTDDTDLISIGNTLTFIRSLIGELKAFTATYTFACQAEEIRFFKQVKPIFLTQFLYHKKLFSLRLFDSFKDYKTRQANHYKVLEHLEKYTRKHHEFYEYCMTGNETLDAHYFTRNNQPIKNLDRDEQFTTGYDTMLSKIFANELLKKYILKSLADSQSTPESSAGALTWTGSKTDLIELIYALHAAGVLNNGSADIKQLASTFEHLLNVTLGDIYRTFLNIRIRKSGQTNFLDKLRQNFVQKVNEMG